MKEEDKILPYDLSSRLKDLDYNEYSDWMYETSRLHNGEELGSDEEFELRCEGKPYTIEYVPGGLLTHNTIRNDYDWLAPEACSAPFIHDVVDWFEEKGIVIVANPSVGLDDNLAPMFTWNAIIYFIGDRYTTPKPDFHMETFTNRYEALKYGIREALDILEESEHGTRQ